MSLNHLIILFTLILLLTFLGIEKIKLSFELEIAFDVSPNPAISPVPFTVSVPPIVVFPSNKALEPVMSPLGVT